MDGYDPNEVVTNVEDSYKENFGYGGLTVGLPGLVNVNMGGYGGPLGFGLNFSALHLIALALNNDKDDQGNTTTTDDEKKRSFFVGQLNADVRLFATQNFLLAFTMAGGTAYYSGKDDENKMRVFYYGPGVHLFYKHLFIETGWAFGYSYDENDEVSKAEFPLFQIGYVGRF